MIELSDEQRKSLDEGKAVRVQENGREYVLLRPDVYDRLAEETYDDSLWEAEELDHLREESTALLDRLH
ncbi:MAG TPA: hypothetical protein VH643_27135 [Gemmataceae bacterium]